MSTDNNRSRMTSGAPAAGNRPLSLREAMAEWDLIAASDAGQAALRAEIPPLTAALARVVVPLLRPGLAALEELSEGPAAPGIESLSRPQDGRCAGPRTRAPAGADRAIAGSAADLTGTMADFDTGAGMNPGHLSE